ncbi:MAG: serine/threonine-protein kinase [Candidatus Eiseniibacteriota bacterium]
MTDARDGARHDRPDRHDRHDRHHAETRAVPARLAARGRTASADAGRSGWLGSGGFESLSPEIQAVAQRRLAGAAAIYAGTYLFFLLLEWWFAISERNAFCLLDTTQLVRSLGSISLSLVVVAIARRGKIPARAFLGLASAYEVVGGLGIASEYWGWEAKITLFLDRLVDSGADMAQLIAEGVPLFGGEGLTWVAIWLLVYPLIVPMPLGRAIVASLMTAATLPAVLVTSQLVHGVPEILHPWVGQLYFTYLIPTLVVAVMATAGCVIHFKLTRELSRARELGAYRLVERIGAGGMGEVWRAEHRLLARPAAIKLIRGEALGGGATADGDRVVRRFEREAQATAALGSPHTIELYDFGIAEDGSFYYVMELLHGLDLNTLVEEHGPLPAERAVHLLLQACHSLEDAHASGLVHRDIKPANLFTCRRGQEHDFVKVLDFGLVKDAALDRRGEARLTQEDITSGTPAYMPPEMIQGAEVIDARADLYALGCVAYWLVTGELVFEGNSPMAILVQHVNEPPPPPSSRTELEIPAALDRLVLDCLAKRPGDRPASARAVAVRLRAVGAELEPWSEERAARWWATHLPALAATGGAGAAGGAGALGGSGGGGFGGGGVSRGGGAASGASAGTEATPNG